MKRKLLFSVPKKAFDVMCFRGSGAGGQHRNRRDSAVRIVHKESNAVGESQEERSQHQNKKIAFRRLTKSTKFQTWIKQKIFKIEEEERVQEKIENWTQPEYIKTEVKINKRWTALENKTTDGIRK